MQPEVLFTLGVIFALSLLGRLVIAGLPGSNRNLFRGCFAAFLTCLASILIWYCLWMVIPPPQLPMSIVSLLPFYCMALAAFVEAIAQLFRIRYALVRKDAFYSSLKMLLFGMAILGPSEFVSYYLEK